MVSYAMLRTSADGLVSHQNDEYTITSVGRHLLLTSASGKTAHAILSEIENAG